MAGGGAAAFWTASLIPATVLDAVFDAALSTLVAAPSTLVAASLIPATVFDAAFDATLVAFDATLVAFDAAAFIALVRSPT